MGIENIANESASVLPLPQLTEVVRCGLHLLTDEATEDACGTRIAFTQRQGGASEGPYATLDLGTHVGDDPAAVEENRRRLVSALAGGGRAASLAVPNQVHGSHVALVAGCTGPGADDTAAWADVRDELAAGADAVVCTDVFRPVCLCFADCTPVILVAPGGAFAIAHAGWRGALAGIAGKAATRLAQAACVEPGVLNAYIGPHIGSCCYEVSDDLLARFVKRFGAACDAGGRHLSLSAAVRASLVEAGVSDRRIADVVEGTRGDRMPFGDDGAKHRRCTSCACERYYSYRASGGTCGRHGAAACRLRRHGAD